jgi:NAD(P)-dependent dehydrogenase (short-subunit alcohol dehydrogenase family)
MGASLIMVGRNPDRGARVQQELRSRCPTIPVDFYCGDLSVLDDVRALAGAIKAKHDRIEVLINNAGARFDDYHESADGFELTLATNHLGHFLLTCLLGDRLLATRSARVITVSSGAHAAASPDEVWSYPKNGYDRRLAYAKSKLANILFATELARRLESTGITSNALHPGGVATNFARNNGLLSWLKHMIAHTMKGELVSSAEGAKTIVYLAADSRAAGFNGQYFFQCRPIEPAPSAMDWTLAKKLWSSSLNWTRLDDSIGIAWKYFEPSF